ncbi:MAG: sigma 54-interacting transcriptional regulator [Clostridiales bacterium]
MSHIMPQSLQWAQIQIEELRERLQKSQAENKILHLKEEQYNDILLNMNEAVEKDNADYAINYVNKAFCDFYGVSQEEVLNTDSMDWVVPEDRERIDRQMQNITPQNPDYRYTCRVRTTRGKEFWIEVLGHCFFDKKGNVLEYQDISRDITHYKSAAEQAERFRLQMEEKVRLRTLELGNANIELSKANSYLQTTLNNISEGVIVVEANGEVMFLNYGSNTAWSKNEMYIRKAIKEAVLQDKTSAIYQLMTNQDTFTNVEITFPTPHGDIQSLVSGAYLKTEDGLPQCVLVLRPLSEVKHLVNKFSGAQARFCFKDIVTQSPIMVDTIKFAEKVAPSDGNVVIEGESGTGKELFAQSIHNGSTRKNEPFVAVNCGAIPRDLIASELFGYADGSFTGAKKGGKPGKFEMATGGTIFLDEIGDMPLEQQISLLRVIQERHITRIGGNKEIPVDVRIICATNKDLIEEVEQGNFRQDLFYRLNVINIHIPPLRQRKEDITLLFKNFISKLNKNQSLPTELFNETFINILTDYNWPGNVRELQNVTERTFFVANKYPLEPKDLPKYILDTVKKEEIIPRLNIPTETISLSQMRKEERLKKEDNEKALILKLLKEFNGNASRVAKEMDISRTALYAKFKKYQIEK